MRLKNVAFLLVGSLAVFVACAAEVSRVSAPGRDAGADAAPSQTARDSIAEATGFDVAPISEAGGDSIGVDVSVNEASAGPTSETLPCNKTYEASTQTRHYAEKAFQGRSKESLAVVQTMVCHSTIVGFPPGYTCGAGGVLVRDGFAASICIAPGDTVTFIDP